MHICTFGGTERHSAVKPYGTIRWQHFTKLSAQDEFSCHHDNRRHSSASASYLKRERSNIRHLCNLCV